MPRSETTGRTPIDWQAWLALAWAAWFGAHYVRMVLDERAPGMANAIGRYISPR